MTSKRFDHFSLWGVLVLCLCLLPLGSLRAADRRGTLSPWNQLPLWVRSEIQGPLENSRNLGGTSYENQYSEWRDRERAQGREGSLAEYVYSIRLKQKERQQLMAFYGKLSAERIWEIVSKINWVSEDGGVMLFVPSMSQEKLQDYLKQRGYGHWWHADSDESWGLRSRYSGAQLHFRGAADHVNVHIDLHNPGDDYATGEVSGALTEAWDALWHFQLDLRDRERTHQLPRIIEALGRQGIVIYRTP